MKILSILSTIIILLTFEVVNARQVTGQSISGAFGKKLGEIHEPANKNKEILLRWTFTPTESSPYFSNYYFWTSPLRRKIIGISGVSGPLSLRQCKSQAKEIMNILETKYSSASKEAASKATIFSAEEKIEKR